MKKIISDQKGNVRMKIGIIGEEKGLRNEGRNV